MCHLQSNNQCGDVLQYSNCGRPSPTYTCAASVVKCVGVDQGLYLDYGGYCSNGRCGSYYYGVPCFIAKDLDGQCQCETS